ncbi:MAG TPA: GNAT family N-acetyltransferase [Terriglobales bacterium]|nr:GNAT family N-acetyltransferase [Terriglobales bacterium]
MLLRLATAADIPTMRQLDLASAFGARWSDAHYEGLFTTADSLKHLVLVAEADRAVIAYLAASGVGAEWELENVIVSPTMLRRGIARALIAELVQRLRAENVERVHLEVRESNTAARGLYVGFGFTQEGRRALYYRGPDEDAIILAFQLAAK